MPRVPAPSFATLSPFASQPASNADERIQEPDAAPERIPEAVLQDIWLKQLFRTSGLCTTTRLPVLILQPGRHNAGDGPDFLEARIQIDEMQWAGDVEIHRFSSDWYAHGHHLDPRYNRVVLHVTLMPDARTGHLRRADGTRIHEVVLYSYLDASLRTLLYAFYQHRDLPFPCADSWATVPPATRQSLIRTLGRERLLERAARVQTAINQGLDPETVLYHSLFRALGYTPNAEAMEALAQRLPLPMARRLNPEDLAVLYLGTAGLLPGSDSLFTVEEQEPIAALHKRCASFHSTLGITPMPPTRWNLSRTRPANRPAVRIVQATRWLRPGRLLSEGTTDRLVDAIRQASPLSALDALLTLPVRDSEVIPAPSIGRQRRTILVTDAVLPFALTIADHRGLSWLETRVWSVFGMLPAARDAVTARFARRGTRPSNAWEAQGLHQLYRTRCSRGGCLDCPAGAFILGPQT